MVNLFFFITNTTNAHGKIASKNYSGSTLYIYDLIVYGALKLTSANKKVAIVTTITPKLQLITTLVVIPNLVAISEKLVFYYFSLTYAW